jgi:hypothetical protein
MLSPDATVRHFILLSLRNGLYAINTFWYNLPAQTADVSD